MSDETTETESKLFRSDSRAQRMFEYALLRTPQYTAGGKWLLTMLAELIEDDQPTPIVESQAHLGVLNCYWQTELGYYNLVIRETLAADEQVVLFEPTGPVSGRGKFLDQGEVVDVLRSVLTGLGQEENPIIK